MAQAVTAFKELLVDVAPADVDRGKVEAAVAGIERATSGFEGDALLVLVNGLVGHRQTDRGQHGEEAEEEAPAKGFGSWRDGIARRVFRVLLPRGGVPEECGLAVLGVLNSRDHSLTFKAMALKWLLLVWELLEGTQMLAKAYGVLFHYLEYDTIRPVLCQLLFKLTTKEHVKLFRCSKLMDLYRRVGHEPSLATLLAAYKVYQPQWITITVSRFKRDSWQVAAERVWQQAMTQVRVNAPMPNAPVQRLAGPVHEAQAHQILQGSMNKRQRIDTGIPAKLLANPIPRPLSSSSSSLSGKQQWHVHMLSYQFLKTWNGHEHANYIFDLVTKVQPRSYDALYVQYLAPLQRLYLSSNVAWKHRLLLAYTKLLGYWATIDWRAHFAKTSEHRRAFPEIPTNVDHFRTMKEFIGHVDRLAVVGLQLEAGHALLEHAALSFFERACVLSRTHGIPFVAIPSKALVVHLLVSPTAMAVSRVCGIIAQYKRSFDLIKIASDSTDKVVFEGYNVSEAEAFGNGIQDIQDFNMFIRDCSNTLWRAKLPDEAAIEGDEETYLFKDLSKDFVGALNARPFVLSLMHSTAFAGFARSFVDTLGGTSDVLRDSPELLQTGLFKPRQLGLAVANFAELRVKLIAFLKQQGIVGVNEFMHTFIQSLVKIGGAN